MSRKAYPTDVSDEEWQFAVGSWRQVAEDVGELRGDRPCAFGVFGLKNRLHASRSASSQHRGEVAQLKKLVCRSAAATYTSSDAASGLLQTKWRCSARSASTDLIFVRATMALVEVYGPAHRRLTQSCVIQLPVKKQESTTL